MVGNGKPGNWPDGLIENITRLYYTRLKYTRLSLYISVMLLFMHK